MIDLIAKYLGFVAATFGIYKALVEVLAGNFSRRKEQYQFSKEYIAEFKKGEMHSFASGHGMYALIQRPMRDAEIRFLLSTDFPFKAIYLRKEVDDLVRFESSENRYSFAGTLKNKFWRKFAKYWYYFAYFVTALLAFFPLLYKAEVVVSNSSIAIICALMAVIAVSCLMRAYKIQRAQEFMTDFGFKAPVSPVADCTQGG